MRAAPTFLLTIVLAASLSGCVTAGGPAAAVSDRPVGATGPGMAGDGVAGGALAGVPRGDRARALAAEFQALEFSSAGEAVEWRGARGSGRVVALAPFAVGSQNCRQLTHTIMLGGQSTVAQGSACREPGGVWTPLS